MGCPGLASSEVVTNRPKSNKESAHDDLSNFVETMANGFFLLSESRQKDSAHFTIK